MNLLITEALPAVSAFLSQTVSTAVFYAVKNNVVMQEGMTTLFGILSCQPGQLFH